MHFPPLRFLALLPLVAAGIVNSAHAAPKDPVMETYEPWKPEIVEQFRAWPILDGGRVKPMEAIARVRLLSYNGKRTFKFDVGTSPDKAETVKISATEWLLDVLFRPEIAKQQPCFLVNDSDAVTAIGVSTHEKRRSRYSYNELEAGRAKLAELRAKYGEMKPEDRGGRENQIFDLGSNVSEFEFAAGLFGFARDGLAISGKELAEAGVKDLGPMADEENIRVTEFGTMVEKVKAIREKSPDESDEAFAARTAALEKALTAGSQQLGFYLQVSHAFTLTPPKAKDEVAWLSPGALLDQVVNGSLTGDAASVEWEATQLKLLEDIARAEPDSEAFLNAMTTARSALDEAVAERGEGKSIGTELALYKGNYFNNSLVLFIIGFLFVALGWLAPGTAFAKRISLAAFAVGILALGLLVVGIVLRCVVMGRAPVATLYETILFITAVSVLVAFIIEGIVRWKIALSVGLALGMMGMFLSWNFDVSQAEDTMGPIVAVLRSNYWLGTHVTTVTMGYAAALLAGAISHFYLFSRLFSPAKPSGPRREMFRVVTRMTYGVICFALLLSLVGTVLGGIWANDSWGRFWGWDPKENGAFMIVLWNLIILHARMGGYVKELGIHILAVVGSIIVGFSWWYVNVMGVGLHSYGFTSGIKRNVLIFWCVELAVLMVGFIVWLRMRNAASTATLEASLPGKPGKARGTGEPAIS